MQRVALMQQRSLAALQRTHSKRTLKRLRGHPSGWHRRGYEQSKKVPQQSESVLKWEASSAEAINQVMRPSGYVPPQGASQDIPFRVERTTKGRQLPVYTDYRNGRTRVMTILRRYKGDTHTLRQAVSEICDGRPVIQRPGRLELKGDYSKPLKDYLARLGF
eukprot:gb/GECG01000191.1/.p1 GENE.gb/GECG01000191.1/~~gb/GECG01000191.1/.p1  ORF type:complete len:162 (+),score=10.76 gb/GECG01000191.1/:1-486(+)